MENCLLVKKVLTFYKVKWILSAKNCNLLFLKNKLNHIKNLKVKINKDLG